MPRWFRVWLAGALGLGIEQTETGAAFSTVCAAVSAAVRLGKLGALEAQAMLTRIRDTIAHGLSAPPPVCAAACTPLTDIAVMRHANSSTRLFATPEEQRKPADVSHTDGNGTADDIYGG